VIVRKLYCERGSGHQELAVKTQRVKTKINNNYDIHKTKSLLQIIILNLNKIKNIGGDKILAPTKYTRQQNIRVDKIIGAGKIYARQNYLRRQNICVDKMLALTKYQRRQNICLDKMLALTTYQHRQNAGVDKILALTKCWRRQKDGADAEESPYCLARQNLQLLASPLKISYVFPMVLFSLHALVTSLYTVSPLVSLSLIFAPPPPPPAHSLR
jgi:hypothetical protein